jgi:alpha-1,3-glucosyltransferase
MFGWHVHEKAILMVLIPLSLLAAEKQSYFRTFMIASIAGIYSLFPLIFTPAETLLKIMYSTMWVVVVYELLNRQVYEFPPSLPYVIIDVLEKIYLVGFPILHGFNVLFPFISERLTMVGVQLCDPENPLSCVHEQGPGTVPGMASTEFLPLMLTSVYCAAGLVWAFLRLSVLYIRQK